VYEVTAVGVVIPEPLEPVPDPSALTARNLILYRVAALRFDDEELTVVMDTGDEVVPEDFHVEPLSVEYS